MRPIATGLDRANGRLPPRSDSYIQKHSTPCGFPPQRCCGLFCGISTGCPQKSCDPGVQLIDRAGPRLSIFAVRRHPVLFGLNSECPHDQPCAHPRESAALAALAQPAPVCGLSRRLDRHLQERAEKGPLARPEPGLREMAALGPRGARRVLQPHQRLLHRDTRRGNRQWSRPRFHQATDR